MNEFKGKLIISEQKKRYSTLSAQKIIPFQSCFF